MYREELDRLIAQQHSLSKELKGNMSDDIVAKFRENDKRILAEFSINLNDTVDYYNNCDEEYLMLLSILIADLTEYFRSDKLVNCFANRIAGVKNPTLKQSLEFELDFIRGMLKK